MTEVRTDPAMMEAVPDVVAPGGRLEVVFPTEAVRGPGFVLERDTDDGWQWWFTVSSDTDPRTGR